MQCASRALLFLAEKLVAHMSHGGRYTIHLKGLPQGVSTEDFVVESAFLESRPTFDLSGGPVVCTIRVDRVGETYDLLLTLAGSVQTHCDRCLAPLEMRIDTSQHIVVKLGDQYEEVSDEEIIVPHHSPSLDCADLIYDLIVLSLPISRMHPEGECTEDMQAILDDLDPAAEEETDGRWAKLSALRNSLQQEKDK